MFELSKKEHFLKQDKRVAIFIDYGSCQEGKVHAKTGRHLV
jgi:hypothetical protein